MKKHYSTRLETREQIIDAARVVLAEVGRDNFTTKAVCDRLGIPPGTLFRIFPTRLDLLNVIQPVAPQGVAAVLELHENVHGLCKECATSYPCRTIRALKP